MPVPSTKITKQDGNTGVVRPSPVGILAIIAPGTGTANQVASYASPKAVFAAQGYTPLSDIASYVMNVTGNSVVCVPPTCSTSAAYSAMTLTGTGTSVPSAHSGDAPLDDYNVLITVTLGGTVSTGPISYTYSLDGGQNTSAVQSLGTATTIAIPNTGIGVDLTHTSNTLVTGDTITFTTTAARPSDSDLSTAYTALQSSSLPFEGILIFGTFDASAVSTIDTFLSGLESNGRYYHFYGNSSHKAAATSEATYLTSMTSAYASASSIRGCIGADSVTIPNSIPGFAVNMVRDAAIDIAARCMSIDVSADPAYVADGPVGGFIYDTNGNPIHHDEMVFPGLDDIRLSPLRSFAGFQGVYVNNANVISPNGSDYVFIQHVRVMNLACSLTFQVLTQQLSLGVEVAPNAQIGSGVYITEADAQRIEALVNQQLNGQLVKPKRVSGALFVLSRTDDLSANSGETLNGDVQISALRYVKKFAVNAFFVKTVSAAST